MSILNRLILTQILVISRIFNFCPNMAFELYTLCNLLSLSLHQHLSHSSALLLTWNEVCASGQFFQFGFFDFSGRFVDLKTQRNFLLLVRSRPTRTFSDARIVSCIALAGLSSIRFFLKTFVDFGISENLAPFSPNSRSLGNAFLVILVIVVDDFGQFVIEQIVVLPDDLFFHRGKFREFRRSKGLDAHFVDMLPSTKSQHSFT